MDTTVHFRFMNVFSNTLIANFDIYMPYQLQKLQARFSHYQLTPGDRFSHQFIDQTDNDFIISWQWDFGDGNTSSMQNPSHTYTEPGLYKIILNMRSEQLGVVESSVTTQQIYISELAYYHMGGHAFAHKFPIDDGLAYLYLADSSKRTLVPIDTCEFDTLGYYYFYQLPQGEYIVKSQPQNSSIYYADMLPTYYGDKIFWQNAKTIQHNETKWEYDIQLTEGEGLSVGMGSISGRVVYQGVNRNGDSIPAQGVDIFLFNTLNENLVSHYSNEEGLFDFSGIQTGDYWVYPEVTGQQSNMLKVTVSESTLNVSDIQITILPTDINLDIPEPIVVSDMSLQKLYPNPARDQINLDFKAAHKQQLNLKIYDMMGRLIQSELVQAQAGSNTVSIGTDKMGNGIYTLGLMINGALSEQRFVVKH